MWITPFIDERSVIFDYLPRDATIIVDEPKLLYDKLELIEKEHSSRVKSLVESGEVLPIHKESILTRAYALTYIRVMKRLAFQQLTALNPVFESNAVYTLKSQQPAKYYLDRNVLYTDVKNFNATGYKVMLCCGDENRAKNVSKSLKENDIYAECDEDFSRSKIIATKAPIRVGFIYHQAKLVVLGMDELFGKIGQKTELSKPKRGLSS